jgi:hypothetical protein
LDDDGAANGCAWRNHGQPGNELQKKNGGVSCNSESPNRLFREDGIFDSRKKVKEKGPNRKGLGPGCGESTI